MPKRYTSGVHVPVFENCISRFLLEIDDSIKWNLHYVEAEHPGQVTMSYYYKYRDAIKEAIEPSDAEDLQIIKSSPMLETLSLSYSLTLTTAQDFIFIFDASHCLSNFSAWIVLEEDMSLSLDQDPYPFLTRITVRATKTCIPKAMIDYITKKFVNLTYHSPFIHHIRL